MDSQLLVKWWGYVIAYWEWGRLSGYILSYSLLHVGLYFSAFAFDRFLFGPYKTGAKSAQLLKHDFFCSFLEIFNFRKAIANIATFGFIAAVYDNLPTIFSTGMYEGSPWVSAVLFLIVFDFFLYWYHRLSHLEPLWTQHRYHHSAEELNPLSDIRIHAISFPFLLILVLLPTGLIVKIPPSILVPFFLGLDFLSICAHSRWNTGYGWLGKYVFVSPRHHRLHHAAVPEKHSNYGTYLVIWDRLFGTYRESHSAFRCKLGIEQNPYVSNRNTIAEYFIVFKDFYVSVKRWAAQQISFRKPSSRQVDQA